jgi:hypothetical protein
MVSSRILAAFVAAFALSTSAPAFALGAIITDPPGASAAVEVREAVAASGGRSIRWGSAHLRGAATTVGWLVPAMPGAALDLVSNGWFEALDAATAPRVVPPDVAPPCGIAGGVEVEGDFTHTLTVAPGSVAVASDRSSLDTVLAAYGLAVTSDLSASVDAAFTSGQAIVVLVYPQTSPDWVTRAVRVVDDAPPSLALGMVAGGASAVQVTAYAFGGGSVALNPGAALALDPSQIVWLSDGTSSYANARDTLLDANPGGWLFETGGHSVVFDGVAVPGASTTPSLTSSYYFRAASYGDATSPPDACANAAVTASTSDAMVALTCPPGALARVGPATAPCQEVVGAGEIDPSTLRCGGIADDVALAMSGLAPAQTWVTRVRGEIPPATIGESANLSPGTAAGEYGPVVTASGYAEPCTAPSGSSSGGSNGSGGAPTTSQGSSSGGTSGSNDPGGGGSSGAVTGVLVAGSAASSASDSSDGCGGDSSDSSDSCDGSGSSADDGGGGCSGGDGGSGDDCSVSRHKRSPASRFLLLLVGMALVARRQERKIRPEDLPADQ